MAGSARSSQTLSTRNSKGKMVRPKIIASLYDDQLATVRQVRKLYCFVRLSLQHGKRAIEDHSGYTRARSDRMISPNGQKNRVMLDVRQPSRSGFTLIELLVVIAIIGVLIAILLPAVQSAREAARSTDCKSRVRQLAMATHMHHDAFGFFPPARYESRPDADPVDQCGLETPTWLARVMPFIEQSALGEQWDFSIPWHQHPESVRKTVPDIFLCPSRRSGTRPLGTRELRTSVAGGGGRLPCG